MTITQDIQTLEPGGLVRLFELDGTELGAGIMRFHGYPEAGSIWWQGQEYSPWPIKAEGFARTGDAQPNPTLSVGNVDSSISALCLAYEDMVGAYLTRRTTLVKYLDAANFEGGVNPTADATQELPPEKWIVERKISEDHLVVQFELASAMDFNGMQLPGRQIIAGHCLWITIGGYRGPYCGYAGPPVAMKDDTPTSDAALDRCGGRVTSCKMRFGEDSELPFGGFPAAGMMRT